jgi:hypothetical protein
MSPVGFEPNISAGERPQTYALDRAATVTGIMANYLCVYVTTKVRKRSLSVLNDQHALWQKVNSHNAFWSF